MQMYIALYALVTWQLKLKTLSVKNLFSNCLWFSYSSTFHLFSIYKTMVHNKSDLAQSIILWSSPGQIFIQGIWLRIDENRVNFFIFILRSKWPSWTMVQLEFMTDSSVQEPQWRFKVKLEKNECTKSMKKFQINSDHAMQSYRVTMRMKGLLTNKTICYLHFANIIYQLMHFATLLICL